MPTTFDLTGDERWASDGELYRGYDLEFDDAADQESGNDADVEFTTDTENDPDKIINFSKMYQALGVKALSENDALENENIGDNGGDSAICSDYSAGNIYDEFSGILPFN